MRLMLDGVQKSFGATAALRGVSLGVGEGEVHALIGENGPEGQRKLAGGRAKRKPPDHRMKTTSAPDGAAEPRGISRAPAGAHDFLTKRSGGSRSLRSLHHRLISVRPPGGEAEDFVLRVESAKKDRGFITTAYALGEELAPGLWENHRCNTAEKQ